jgi:AraC family transcriptional regulator of adaptative response/methylated-DNA-[protein]-cysteine methyltransferase
MNTSIGRAAPIATLFDSDAQRWDAVRHRDPRADGAFFYSVRTTGVYCRPSCASRLARREASRSRDLRDAERAGFSPANAAGRTGAARGAASRGWRSVSDDRASEAPPSLDALATPSASAVIIFTAFQSVTGVTPKAYADARRADACAPTSEARDGNRRDLRGRLQFDGRFYEHSAQTLGMQPRDYRAGGSGASIRFAVGQCSLGSILVAATERGVCAITLGDDPDALVRDLQDRFPSATLTGGDAAFERWVAKVVGFVEAPRLGLDLPLDVRGTAFQQRVWRALREIPAGSTASYADIATKLGARKRLRAVAQACAANALAVAIPCHRIVRKDGALSGYRWGVERKRELLKREATAK